MTKKNLFTILLIVFLPFAISAQTVNYDESKVAPYNLEDPLVFANGKTVETIQDWEARRTEILELFQDQMYGRMPEKTEFYLEEIEQGVTMAGYAKRKQVRMWFDKDRQGQSIDWLILYPTHTSDPVPAVISLNYDGNHTIIKDKEVILDSSIFIVDGDAINERGSGHGENTLYPVEMLLSKGIAFVTACYLDVSPDPPTSEGQADHAYTGIFDLWGQRDESREDNTTSLMAWAWALCRGLDMIEQDPDMDGSRVMVTGCSRLAKAALIAGAFDSRFAVVAPIQTGGGGAPLAKRNFGENVTTENRSFTHWYCKAYRKYAGHEQTMPFDQHLLCACVAPRYLIVGGFNEQWFDTKGEFLSLQAASPVWEKFCGSGLPRVPFPASYSTSAIGTYLGYYRRENRHGIYSVDWNYMMDFASRPLQLDILTDCIGVEVPTSSLSSLKKMKAPILAAKSLFPNDSKADIAITETMKSANIAGIRTIVMELSSCKHVCEICRKIGCIAKKYNVTVVVEINSLREGISLVKEINHPNIRLSANISKMIQTGEDAGAILEAGDLIQHCHIVEINEDIKPYLRALKGISYKGPITVSTSESITELKKQLSSL